MGFTNISIVDFDIVAEENLYPAFFPYLISVLF